MSSDCVAMPLEKHSKRHPHCGVAGHPHSSYSERWDTFACLACDRWLEALACVNNAEVPEPGPGEEPCYYCTGRPDVPSTAFAVSEPPL